jgi:hypothetical protein
MTHKKFREVLLRDLVIQSHKANVTVSGVFQGRPTPSSSQLSRLEVKHLQHAFQRQAKALCCVFLEGKNSTLYYCKKCDIGLRILDCFEKWHVCDHVS